MTNILKIYNEQVSIRSISVKTCTNRKKKNYSALFGAEALSIILVFRKLTAIARNSFSLYDVTKALIQNIANQ